MEQAMPKLMIVDDETSNLDLFRELFVDEEDMTIECYASGNDALDAFDNSSPDVMILDVMMPGKTGFEVCEEIKAKAKGSKTKVIIVTGMAGDEVEQKAREVGCDSFYLKPVDMMELYNEVMEAQ